jgi:tetratricopeptide (TPR) repeat protein
MNQSMDGKAQRVQRIGSGARVLCLAIGGLVLGAWPPGCAATVGAVQETDTAGAQSFQQLAERAEAAMEANQVPEAIRLYERATAMRPTWSEGWWYLGTLFFDSEQFTQARDAFAHFVAVEHEQAGPGFGMLGLAEFELKDYPRALSALERGRSLGLGDNPEFERKVLYVDGILSNYLGEPEVALVRLTRYANELAVEHLEAPKEAVLENTDLLDALGLAALHIRELPAEISAAQAGLVRQAGHAQGYIALKDQTDAGKEIRQLVAQHGSEPGVHYMFGVYLLNQDRSSAIEEFRNEITISPQNAPAYVQLALEFLRTSDYKQGLTYAQKAVELEPSNFVAHVACGRLWLGEGNTDRALHELRTAVKLAPESPDAHFALARALREAGKSGEAAQERAEFERLKALANAADRKQ